MGWKYGVHETENAKACFNACVYATKDEAERAAEELFSRWYAPHHWSVYEVEEPANYTFPAGDERPSPIREVQP